MKNKVRKTLTELENNNDLESTKWKSELQFSSTTTI